MLRRDRWPTAVAPASGIADRRARWTANTCRRSRSVFGGVINLNAARFEAVVAAARGSPKGRAKRAFDHDR